MRYLIIVIYVLDEYITGMGYFLANIVIFVIIQPLLILLFFILWRYERNKNRNVIDIEEGGDDQERGIGSFKNIIPPNVRMFMADLLGSKEKFTEKDLTPEYQKVLLLLKMLTKDLLIMRIMESNLLINLYIKT
jgi:hypothetical protein